jgi:hypothetical protein
LEQLIPVGQTLPQLPQLLLSVWRLRQVVPQSVCPAVVQVQTPLLQEVPVGQVVPQVPQWVLEVLVLTQAPLQFCCPLGQAHTPLEQLIPLGQVLPQLPQLLLSVCRLRQFEPHSVSDELLHVQTPLLQDVALGQERLH